MTANDEHGNSRFLRYADALRTAAATDEPGERLYLISSTTTTELGLFLHAYARRRGAGWDVEHGDYGPLRLQLEGLADHQAPLVVLVVIEDVFPELSYRADTEWTPDSLTHLLAESWARADEASQSLRAAVSARRGPVIVIPPLLGAPALPMAPASAVAGLRLLSGRVAAALDRTLDDTPAVVLDGQRALASLASHRWRDDGLTIDTGSPLSTEAASMVARSVDALLGGPERGRKVLVTDLDGTLWRGTASENAPEELNAHPYGPGHVHRLWQRVLLLLRSRGILLAICSVNDAEVLELLTSERTRDTIGLIVTRDDFATASVAWTSKSSQLKQVASDLGVGPDALVFVDDDPAQIAEVAHSLPEVLALRYPADAGDFDAFLEEVQEAFAGGTGSLTPEDRRRAELYAARQRVERELSSAESPQDYLASLGMRLLVSEVTADTSGRAQQLLNRTNQFHLTGRRYPDAEWDRLRGERGTRILVARLTDRYLDHGICLMLVLRPAGPGTSVAEFALSCRVFNRGVETAVLGWLRGRFAHPLSATWVPTGRNERVRDAFLENGWTQEAADSGHPLVARDPGGNAGRSHVEVEEA